MLHMYKIKHVLVLHDDADFVFEECRLFKTVVLLTSRKHYDVNAIILASTKCPVMLN